MRLNVPCLGADGEALPLASADAYLTSEETRGAVVMKRCGADHGADPPGQGGAWPGGRLGLASLVMSLPLLAGGCTGVQTRIDTEQRLAAAGFEARNAGAPGAAAELQRLEPNQVIARREGNGFRYLYADPKQCHCLYVGDEKAYQAYQRLSFQDRIANQNRAAAEAYRDPFGWGPWGGWGGPFYPREVIVDRDHDDHHH